AERAPDAERGRQRERGDGGRAGEGAREARRQLARFCVANGTRIVEEGDRLGSLVWFAEALEQEPDDPVRREMQRVRLGAVLRQCPRLLQIWFEKKPVYHVAFSPDGRRVAIASGDLHFMSRATGEVRVLDAVTGEPIVSPLKHAHPVYHVAFSADGGRLVTGSGGYVPIGERTVRGEGEVRVWDLTSGKQVTPSFKHATTVEEVSFSPDGRSVISLSGARSHGASGELRIRDIATGKPTGKPFTHNRVHYMTTSPDGKRVAVGSWMDAGV